MTRLACLGLAGATLLLTSCGVKPADRSDRPGASHGLGGSGGQVSSGTDGGATSRDDASAVGSPGQDDAGPIKDAAIEALRHDEPDAADDPDGGNADAPTADGPGDSGPDSAGEAAVDVAAADAEGAVDALERDVAPDIGGLSDTGGVIGGIQHPGLVSSEAELDRIRAIVTGAASHPMKDGWTKMRGTRFAKLTYQATPYAIVHVVGSGGNDEEAALRNDAVAAYAHALQFAVLDDPQYSAKAIEIISAWAKVLVDVVPASASDPSVQDELEVAWYAPIWLNAAEIIRFHRNGAAQWSAADRADFDKMVVLFKTKADAWPGSKGCCPNQGLSVALSRMSIGVYTSDRKYFDAAVTFYTGTMLPRAIGSSGEVLEINRSPGGDCGHATYNIEGIFDIAETAWHQGTDLYASPLLPKGLEYLAQLDTTGAATTSEGFVTCTTRPSSIEIAYNHYANRLGTAPLPHTLELLAKIRPTDQGTGKFIPWDTLTHAELGK